MTRSSPSLGSQRSGPGDSASNVEIDEIEAGRVAVDDSPLRHAPHTVADLVDAEVRPYPAAVGALTAGRRRWMSYYPPVSRIDAAYGDRNLMCSCAPLEAYAESHT